MVPKSKEQKDTMTGYGFVSTYRMHKLVVSAKPQQTNRARSVKDTLVCDHSSFHKEPCFWGVICVLDLLQFSQHSAKSGSLLA